MAKLTLTFSGKNNFDPNKPGCKDKVAVATNIRWLLGCAESAIEKSYSEGAPRLIEMRALCTDLRNQLKKQLTEEEAEKVNL